MSESHHKDEIPATSIEDRMEHRFDVTLPSCWIASLALQQHFPIQTLLVFLRFKLLPNFIFQCYRPQTWQIYLFFPDLSFSAAHEVLGIKFKGARSCDP